MFHGSMVAIVTPMDKQDNVDYEAFSRLIDFHLDNQTDAIVVAGTTGESAALMAKEHQHLIRAAVEQVRGKIPIIAGSGSSATSKAIELTRSAMEMGADACLLMAPAYNKPTQEGLYLHYKAIADAVPIPQILYNVPGRTACDILPDTVARLAESPNIVGIKEATGSPERAQEIVQRCGNRLDVFSGDDFVTKDLIRVGAKGVISVTANVAPQLVHDFCAAALAGDEAKAAELDSKIQLLTKALFCESNPIPCKWAVAELGLMQKGIRLPLTPLAEQHQEEVRAAMQQIGIL